VRKMGRDEDVLVENGITFNLTGVISWTDGFFFKKMVIDVSETLLQFSWAQISLRVFGMLFFLPFSTHHSVWKYFFLDLWWSSCAAYTVNLLMFNNYLYDDFFFIISDS
jgi:hypothetical protein